MNNEELNEGLDYKKLYIELKEKYEKIKNENEELKNENKIKENNSIYKTNSKKYETYSCDSFRNEVEHNNDLINDLIKIDLMKIENVTNFQIITNKKNIKSIIFDIDEILLNIKKKQESLNQTQKMLNIKKDN